MLTGPAADNGHVLARQVVSLVWLGLTIPWTLTRNSTRLISPHASWALGPESPKPFH